MEAAAKPELVKASEADNEENPFEAMMQRFDRAAELLSLDHGLYRILRHPEKQIITSIPVVIERTLNAHAAESVLTLELIRRTDAWARNYAGTLAGDLQLMG